VLAPVGDSASWKEATHHNHIEAPNNARADLTHHPSPPHTSQHLLDRRIWVLQAWGLAGRVRFGGSSARQHPKQQLHTIQPLDLMLPPARPPRHLPTLHTYIYTHTQRERELAAFRHHGEEGAAVAAAGAEGSAASPPSSPLVPSLFPLLATFVMAAAANSVMDVEEAVEDAAVVLLENKVPSMSMLNEKEVGREGGKGGREGGRERSVKCWVGGRRGQM